MAEIRQNCPYCSLYGKDPDTKRHLYINSATQMFMCHRCGHKGKWEDVVITDDTPIVSNLKRFDSVEIFRFNLVPTHSQTACNVRDAVLQYARNRLPEDVVFSKTGWSPDLPTRWFFPLYVGGILAVWQGRTIDNSKPKYLSWGKVSEYIYGFDDAEGYAVLCEGPVSALSSPNGICIFGKSLSDIQLMLIVSKFKKVYLAKEKGAEREWAITEKKLSKYIEVVPLDLGDKDPNDIGMEKMKELVYAR